MALNAANSLWALGRLELACGRPAEALTALRQIQGDGDLSHPLIALQSAPDLVEAAARTGERGAAHDAAERFEAWADAAGSTWTRAMRASVRALLADGDEADQHYLEASGCRDPSRAVRDRTVAAAVRGASASHAPSPWLARADPADADGVRRRRDRTFADRARAELRAAGEGARRATRADRSTMAALTPQERQVALHASEGATNKEIAALLFISRRTVEHHLTHAFDKLGVRSRVELVRTLADGGGIGDTSRP